MGIFAASLTGIILGGFLGVAVGLVEGATVTASLGGAGGVGLVQWLKICG